ncbi:hypothetical protein FACS189479_02760 [Spirochaetia bacterium]|nr:hypothetical protein FACS189479_02760 [Spirochaetia bacterium]
MKRKVWEGIAITLVILMVGACATSSAKQKTEILDDKGAAHNQPTPPWVLVSNESNINIQKLPDYEGSYCFVVLADATISPDTDYDAVSRQYVIDWVNNTANGAQRVAEIISTTVTNDANTKNAGSREGAASPMTAQTQSAVQKAMSNASFTGLLKAADWWELTRNKTTGEKRYNGYSLWIIDEKRLDDQIARHLQNIVGNNEAMSAAERSIYLELINDIRANGIFKSSASSSGSAVSVQTVPNQTAANNSDTGSAQAPTSASTYTIGAVGPAGGRIFYDKHNNSSGWQYLEAAPANTERELSIGIFPEIRERRPGMGKVNTETIMKRFEQQGGGTNTAAWYCDQLDVNGIDDWYLPTMDELLLMYNYLDGFTQTKYWSSNHVGSGENNNYLYVDFSRGGEEGNGWSSTSTKYRVRAVRQF